MEQRNKTKTKSVEQMKRRTKVAIALLIVTIMFAMAVTIQRASPASLLYGPSERTFAPSGEGDDWEIFVNIQPDLHPETDIGTHSDWTELQDEDSTYDTLTEGNTGGSAIDESLDVNGYSNDYNSFDTEQGASPYLNAQDEPTNYIHEAKSSGATSGWYDFANTAETTDGIAVTLYFYCYGDDTNDQIQIYEDWTGSGGGSQQETLTVSQTSYGSYLSVPLDTATHTGAEINLLRVYFSYLGVQGGDDIYIDHVYARIEKAGGDNFDLDLEVGWDNADYDETSGEELVIWASTQGSEALRVDVWSGSWINVFTDIAVGENSVDVSAYLVDATFEIRFTDTTDDAVEADEYLIDCVFLHVWTDVPANEIPVNDQVPALTDADDGDNMYAQYQEYTLVVYVSDQDGFADIDYLEVSLWDDSQTTEYFRFRYDEDTNTFTEEYDSGTVVVLNTGGSSAVENVNDIDATFLFTIDWDHADLTDVDMECYVVDDTPESDSDFYEANFDVETRLDYSVGPSITGDDSGTVDRGDLNEAFDLDGTLIYYGSTDDNPASDQVDVWVSATLNSAAGPWSDLTLTAGAFSVAPVGDDIVGIDTYTVKPVLESAGSGGASLYYTTDLTDDYISDRIQVQSYTVTDDRVNLNDNVNVDILLYYDYDNSDVTTGTLTINGNALSHQGSGTWRFTDSESAVTMNTYDTVAGSDTTHGLTAVDQNSQTQDVIWDQIVVMSYTIVTPVGDSRVSTGVTVTIDVELHYDYDEADVVDGTVTVNGLGTAYQSAGKWRFTDSEATVMMNTYDTVVCTGNAEGITTEDNTVTQDVIWDNVRVVSYTFIAGDARVDLDVTVTMDVELHYDYDETDVVDGTVTVNGFSTVYQSAGKWRFSDSEASVLMNTYDTAVCTGNAEGIDTEDNTVTQEVIWDQIVVMSYTFIAGDNRVDVDATVTIDVELHYDYDESDVVDGTVTVNGLSTVYQSLGKWRFSDTEASVMANTYNTVVCTGNEHGITVEDNTITEEVIWDQIVVVSYTFIAGDGRVDLDATVTLDVELHYDYDDTDVADGTVTVNGLDTVYQSLGKWRFSDSESTVMMNTYDTVVCTGNEHGITLEDNSVTEDVIWDQIVVVSYAFIAGDDRVDTDVTVTIDVELHYDYDDTDVVDGTVTVNGHSTTYQSLGEWRFTDSEATVMANTYDTVQATGNAHGITVEDNTVTQQVIWDHVRVVSYTIVTPAGDSRVDTSVTVTIDIELHYDYDETDVVDGTVTVNGLGTAYQSAGKWRFTDSEATVMMNTYNTMVCTGNTEGITVEDNTITQDVIWDQIRVISYTIVTPAGDSRVSTGTTVTIDVELHYDYDESDIVDGTVTVNGFGTAYQSAGKWRFTDSEATVMMNTYDTVVCTGNAEGITIEDNTVTQEVIWDNVQVQSYSLIGGDDRINTDATVTIDIVLWYDYDNTLVVDGTVTVNGQSASHQGSGVWRFTDSESSVVENTYDTVAASGNAEDIDTVDQNGQSESCIWDRLVIDIQADDETPENDVQVTFTVTIIYDFDDTPCTTYDIWIKRGATDQWDQITTSPFYDTNNEVAYDYLAYSVVGESTYDITVFTTNTETVTWSSVANEVPVNDSTPTISNADDTDNLYAVFRFYLVTSYVSDQDGYTDITYVELSIWDNGRGTEYIRIRYTVIGSAFSVELGSAYITLSGSDVTETGNDIDIEWSFEVDWDFPDLTDLDIEQYVLDAQSDSDLDWYEVNWEIETRLDFSVGPALSDDRGNINTADLVGTGTVTYYTSALFPISSETDVWIVHDVSGTWSGEVSSGAFSIPSIGSSASVRLNTYTFKIVEQGAGSGGADLYYTTSLEDTFITDRIQVQSYTVTDARVNLNDNVNIDILLYYDYDNSDVTTGTFTVNGDSLAHQGSGTWRFTDSESSVLMNTYDTVAGSDSAYDITNVDQNSQTQDVIWDQIVVMSYTFFSGDGRVDTDVTVTIDVELHYDYDETDVVDGTVTVNGLSRIVYDLSISR